MDSVKKFFGKGAGDGEGADNAESGFLGQVADASTLSYSKRIKGFIICFVAGIICSFLGCAFFWMKNGILIFCLFYSIGNLISLASTLFLMGPVKQLKNMFARTRVIATVVMLLAIVATIVSALFKKKLLVLMFCVIEFLAMTWYSISYIPFARDAVVKCFEGWIG